MFWNHSALTNKFALFVGTELKWKLQKMCKFQFIIRTWKLMFRCCTARRENQLVSFSIPDAYHLRQRLCCSFLINRHVYQSSWVHTCIRVPGFTRVSNLLGSHVYQSSKVHTFLRVPGFTHVYQSFWFHICIRFLGFTRVSDFLGSHVYQSFWVQTCIRVPCFTRVSEFLGLHVYQNSWVHTCNRVPGSIPASRVPVFTSVSNKGS